MNRFQSKVAIVTGGARGIGETTALRLASEGAQVAVFDINEQGAQNTAAKIRSATGSNAQAYRVDVSNRRDVEASVREVAATFGRIDILVNNAGILRDNLLNVMTDEDWDQVMDINLKGAFLCSQAVEPHMKQQQYGRIVMLSSQAAVGRAGRLNYAASKAGIQGLTKSLAMELGPFNITVNAVAPGFIDTEMSKASIASAKQRGIDDFEAYKQQLIDNNPIRRVGTTEDVSNVIAFLSSDEAGYVTGQIIYVAGRPVV